MLAAKASVASRPLRPEPTIIREDGKAGIEAPHSDASGQAYAIMDALATTSNAFVSRQLLNLANLGSGLGTSAGTDDLGSALAIIGAVEPRNELEAALAVQMAMTHQLSATMLQRAHSAGTIKAMTEYGSLATKAARTFTAQMEALTKFRSGGKQIVEHRHIYIDNRGGQTVVAENMTTGVPGHERHFADQSHALGPAMFGENSARDGMSGAPHQRPEAVPNARGPRRRAKG